MYWTNCLHIQCKSWACQCTVKFSITTKGDHPSYPSTTEVHNDVQGSLFKTWYMWDIKCMEYQMYWIYFLHNLYLAYPSTTEVDDDVTGPVDRQHRCSQILQLLTFSLMAFLWEIYKCIQLSKKNLFFRRWMKNIFLLILPECLLLYNI